MEGIIILAVYAAVMILATVTLTRREKNVERFCVGSRSEGWLLSALSIGASWIWAPALFTSTERAYTQGWVGLFWFLVPNVLCLIIFIPFAKRIRTAMPEGITLSGYMKDKYNSEGVKRVYLFQLIGLAVLSTGVQLLAGSQLLSVITGLPFWTLTIILALIALSYAMFSGIKASMTTDAIQMIFMLVVCALFMIFGVRQTGTQSILKGMSGISGEYTSLFSKQGLEVFLSFGLPTAIGLIAGPFGDQTFWQRSFAVKKDRIGRSFSLGAILFGLVPLSMGILGFMGAGIGYQVSDTSVANFELIQGILPTWAVIPFLFMIISGLLSTVDSNLCSISALTTDISGGKDLKKSKAAMIALLIAGILIANIPGMTVTNLFLFYGTLRAATLLPTVLSLKNVRLSAKGVMIGVIAALVVGLPIFACGTFMSNGIIKSVGSLTTVLLAGIAAIVVTRWEGRNAGPKAISQE